MLDIPFLVLILNVLNVLTVREVTVKVIVFVLFDCSLSSGSHHFFTCHTLILAEHPDEYDAVSSLGVTALLLASILYSP